MKRWWWVWAGLAVSAVLVALGLRGTPQSDVRKMVEAVAQATEVGINRRDLSAVEPFFAMPAEGANIAGLGQTIGQLRTFTTHLSASDQVQFHSFQVQDAAVHESDGLARDQPATLQRRARQHGGLQRRRDSESGAAQDVARLAVARGARRLELDVTLAERPGR